MNINDIEIPVEIQFLPKDERRRARIEEISHLIYKYLQSLVLAKTTRERDDSSTCRENENSQSCERGLRRAIQADVLDMKASKNTGNLDLIRSLLSIKTSS